jgi:AbrB family looped-hinge helix DNA binding protein
MEATIDRFGRILIPYKLRKMFGLRPGTILEVQGSEKGIHIKPVEEKPSLFKKEGVLVFSASPVGDIIEVLKNVRSERTEVLMTLPKK